MLLLLLLNQAEANTLNSLVFHMSHEGLNIVLMDLWLSPFSHYHFLIYLSPSVFLTLSSSARINVSLEGQFLHYIHRHQFLDSPEWESLRPNEDGNFQVQDSPISVLNAF